MTDDFIITARISVSGATSEREAFDGHLLYAQRQARVISVEPESWIEERLEVAHQAYELAAENLNKLIDRREFYREFLLNQPSYMRGRND